MQQLPYEALQLLELVEFILCSCRGETDNFTLETRDLLCRFAKELGQTPTLLECLKERDNHYDGIRQHINKIRDEHKRLRDTRS